jgi:hypothetical protein
LVQTHQNGKKYTKWPQTIPNDHKLYQMALKLSKWSLNIPTFSIPRPSKIYPDWDFWFENKLSGNPASQQSTNRSFIALMTLPMQLQLSVRR